MEKGLLVQNDDYLVAIIRCSDKQKRAMGIIRSSIALSDEELGDIMIY